MMRQFLGRNQSQSLGGSERRAKSNVGTDARTPALCLPSVVIRMRPDNGNCESTDPTDKESVAESVIFNQNWVARRHAFLAEGAR